MDGSEKDTVLVMRSMRKNESVYKNKAALEVVDIEKQHPSDFSKFNHIMKGEKYRQHPFLDQ